MAFEKARGERVGQLGYGYRLAPDGRSLEPDEAKQWVLAHVCALRTEGLSLRTTVGALAALGLSR